jgi:hypothetical protein
MAGFPQNFADSLIAQEAQGGTYLVNSRAIIVPYLFDLGMVQVLLCGSNDL